MYHADADVGGSAIFWEHAWSDGSYDDALKFCEIDPLRPLLQRYAKLGCRMLEGGCGRGQYVVYYTARGCRVVGLDFARDALARLRARQPDLPLCVGDVSALPFRKDSFDVYYSGGVVEHFEEGPEVALQEARRVLRPNGVLLVSVPYLSPLRRVLSGVYRKDRRFVETLRSDHHNGPRRFYQYAFTRQEFEGILRQNGFRIEFVQGYAILWGLSEFPGFSKLLRLATRSRRVVSLEGPASGDATPERKHSSALKRLLVGEDKNVMLVGRAIPLLQWACANMMMYVCSVDSHSP